MASSMITSSVSRGRKAIAGALGTATRGGAGLVGTSHRLANRVSERALSVRVGGARLSYDEVMGGNHVTSTRWGFMPGRVST